MKKFLTVCIVLGIIVVLAGVGYFAFTDISEPMYKKHIQHLVKKYTHRDLNIQGKLGIDLGWHPTITFNEVSLSNAPWSQHPQMLKAKKVSMDIVLHDLVKRKLHTKKVLIENATLLIEVNRKDEPNWPILKKTDDDKPRKLFQEFPTLAMKNVELTYRDLASKRDLTIMINSLDMKYNQNTQQFDTKLKGIYKKYPFNLQVNVDAFGDKHRQVNIQGSVVDAKMSIKGTIKPKSTQYQWLNLAIMINGKNPKLAQQWLGLQLAKNASYQLNTHLKAKGDRYQLEHLNMSINKSSINGQLTIQASNPPRYSGKLNINSTNAGQFLKDFNINQYFSGGKLKLRTHFNTRGTSSKQLISNVSGNASLAILNTNYSGKGSSDMSKLLAKGQVLNSLPINCFIGRFQVNRGMATTPAFVFDAPGATVYGNGSINFINNTLNVRLEPKAKGVKLVSLAIPVQVTGPLSDPRVSAKVPTKSLFAAIVGVASGAGIIGVVGAEMASSLTDQPFANPCIKALQAKPGANG